MILYRLEAPDGGDCSVAKMEGLQHVMYINSESHNNTKQVGHAYESIIIGYLRVCSVDVTVLLVYIFCIRKKIAAVGFSFFKVHFQLLFQQTVQYR